MHHITCLIIAVKCSTMNKWKIWYFVIFSICYQCCQTNVSIVQTFNNNEGYDLKCNHADVDIKYPMYWSRDENIIAWVFSANHNFVYDRQLTPEVDSDVIKIRKSSRGVFGEYKCAYPMQMNCRQLGVSIQDSELRIVTKKKGDTVYLQCAQAQPPILWFKGSELLAFSDIVLQTTNKIVAGSNGTLRLDNVTANTDSGVYECKTEHSNDFMERNLLVISNSAVLSTIQFEQTNDVSIYQRNSELIFSIKDFLSLKVMLILKEQTVFTRILSSGILFIYPERTIGEFKSNGLLIIQLQRITQKDGGNYKFILGKKNGRFYRKHIRVEIDTEMITMDLYTKLSLVCSVAQNQKQPVYWRKDGHVVSFDNETLQAGYSAHGNILTILNATRSKLISTFECFAREKIGKYRLKLREPTTTTTTTTTTTRNCSNEECTEILTSGSQIDELYVIILGSIAGVLLLAFIVTGGVFKYLFWKYANRNLQRRRNGFDNNTTVM